MTDYSKINIDPTEFDKSAYQKALDTLENPETDGRIPKGSQRP